MSNLSSVIIPAAATIIVAIIEAIAAVDRRKAKQEAERTKKRAERRAKESRLSMDLMAATCGLAIDTACALRDGHTNGTLAGNLGKAREAQAAYTGFLREMAANEVSKV